MDHGTMQGIATILAMAAFLGVCWWAYSSHKKKDFDEAAQLPFVDDELPSVDDKSPADGDSQRQASEPDSPQSSQDDQSTSVSRH